MTTWGELTRWSAAPFATAEQGLTSARDDRARQADALVTMATPDVWSGTAADAARAERARLSDALEHILAEVSAARRAVIEAGDAVTGVERAVDAAAEYAAGQGPTISAVGVVTDVRGDPAVLPDPARCRPRHGGARSDRP
ncbi:MAG: hypothetical protein LWW86_04270 [Micrococcales bacterium]|nr:hypothetical protein [Micrococcales bacterium]